MGFVLGASVLLVGGLALAHPEDNVFYACAKANGDIVQKKITVGVQPDCGSNQELVYWNATGPQGAPGVGVADIYTRFAQGDPAIVYCATGDVATGGGGFSPTHLAFTMNRPVRTPEGVPIGWAVKAGTPGNLVTPSVYAICIPTS